MISPIDLSYAAGIIDGEGYIDITVYEKNKTKPNNSPAFILKVSVGMTDHEAVFWLRDMFGGSVYSYEPGRFGGRRSLYQWSVTGAKAAEFCARIRGYLKIKTKHAELAIRYFSDQRIKHVKHAGRGKITPPEDLATRRSYKKELEALNLRLKPITWIQAK